MKKILSIVLLSALCSGCWTPNYQKIPLQTSDVPYVLADGDYMDNRGNLHPNQKDVWAMSQADVYDYMKYVRNLSVKESTIEKLKDAPKKITKNHVIYTLAGTVVVLLLIIAACVAKIKQGRKHHYDDEEEALDDA